MVANRAITIFGFFLNPKPNLNTDPIPNPIPNPNPNDDECK